MSDPPHDSESVAGLPIKRARLAMSSALRELADAMDAGELHYMVCVGLYTVEAAEAKGYAFEQVGGFADVDDHMWMTSLGVLRAAYRHWEERLLAIGDDTVAHQENYER